MVKRGAKKTVDRSNNYQKGYHAGWMRVERGTKKVDSDKSKSHDWLQGLYAGEKAAKHFKRRYKK